MLINKYPDGPFLIEASYALADCYKRQDNPQAAIKIYKNALDVQESISSGFEHYQMGICYKKLGEYKEAGNMFRMVILNPSADIEWARGAKRETEKIDAILKEEEEEERAAAEELLKEKKEEEKKKEALKEEAKKEETVSAVEAEVETEAESEEKEIKELPEEAQTTQEAEEEEGITKQQKIETSLKAAKDYFDKGQHQQAIDSWRDVLMLDVFNTEAKEGIDNARAELAKTQEEQIEDDKERLLLSGVIRMGDKEVAIINGEILKVGDFIDNKEIVEIYSRAVILKDKDGEETEIKLKKQ